MIADDSKGDSMNAETKKQLNVRIPVELYEKISQGDKPQVDIVIEALELYFQDDSKNDSIAIKGAIIEENHDPDYIQSLEQQISSLKDQIKDLREDKSKLMALLNQEQALHMKTQMLLPPAVQHKWWKFWKP